MQTRLETCQKQHLRYYVSELSYCLDYLKSKYKITNCLVTFCKKHWRRLTDSAVMYMNVNSILALCRAMPVPPPPPLDWYLTSTMVSFSFRLWAALSNSFYCSSLLDFMWLSRRFLKDSTESADMTFSGSWFHSSITDWLKNFCLQV